MEISEQINLVVDAREKARMATELRMASYQIWLEQSQLLFDTEKYAKESCQEAEEKLRELAIEAYTWTSEKNVAPGVGIRVMTRLDYNDKEAMEWAMEHKLAVKLDTSAFEKIAKTNNLSFVTISEEPQATIATALAKIME